MLNARITAIAAVCAAAVAAALYTGGGFMEKNKKDAAACNFSEEELRARLSPEQYRVTRGNGTERPFDNKYWNEKTPGIYVDVVSGEPLFSSTEKFDSGTGWPSFSKPLVPGTIVEKADDSLGERRTEVRSLKADSHLGHVFADGPAPGGLRYCVNSAALRLVPAAGLAEAGLGRYLYLFPREVDRLGYGRATFAAGCFWGAQAYFKQVPGVLCARAGYTGGSAANPVYEQVCSGRTGHAEAVDIIFDPARVSYEKLLAHFWEIHDPTSLNRQGGDAGTQYRAVIFYRGPEQRAAAEASREKAAASGKYARPIVTAVEPASVFYDAEEYHQDYLDKNPGGYCHIDLSGASRK